MEKETVEGDLMPILKTENISKHFGALKAVNQVSLSIYSGELTSLIGPNGAGKTTFYNVITGMLPPTSGRVEFDGGDITGLPADEIVKQGLSRTFQITNIFPELSVLDNVRASRIIRTGKSLNVFRSVNGDSKLEEESMVYLDLVGVADQRDTTCTKLSHGDRKRVELALTLASEPKLVFLDEPTAGMNPEETKNTVELIGELAEEKDMDFMVTEHDMDVVFSISERIAVLHQGQILADGKPDEIRENPEVREAYLGKEEVNDSGSR